MKPWPLASSAMIVLARVPYSGLRMKADDSQRSRAKPVNFGVVYGMGAAGLVGYAYSAYGVVMTENEARQYVEAFFDAFYPLREDLYDHTALAPSTNTTTAHRVASITPLWTVPRMRSGKDASGPRCSSCRAWSSRYCFSPRLTSRPKMPFHTRNAVNRQMP